MQKAQKPSPLLLELPCPSAVLMISLSPDMILAPLGFVQKVYFITIGLEPGIVMSTGITSAAKAVNGG